MRVREHPKDSGEMNIPVYTLKGAEKGKVSVAGRLAGPVREDLIRRAVNSERASMRQPYGTDPEAGMRSSATYKGRRGVRHAMMNREMARMKRITSTRTLYMRARIVPQAVKGRRAHPPKAEKNWERKMNKKERLSALLSAASATLDREWVEKRGYRIEGVRKVPLVVEDKLQEVVSMNDVKQILDNFGLLEELSRLGHAKIRSGRGTTRGRRYKRKRGMLIIVNEDRGIVKAARNLPGLEVREAGTLDVDSLAPGAQPGRLCVWTEGALSGMEALAQPKPRERGLGAKPPARKKEKSEKDRKRALKKDKAKKSPAKRAEKEAESPAKRAEKKAESPAKRAEASEKPAKRAAAKEKPKADVPEGNKKKGKEARK